MIDRSESFKSNPEDGSWRRAAVESEKIISPAGSGWVYGDWPRRWRMTFNSGITSLKTKTTFTFNVLSYSQHGQQRLHM